MCTVNIRGHEANFYEAEARCHEAEIEAEAKKSEAEAEALTSLLRLRQTVFTASCASQTDLGPDLQHILRFISRLS